MRIALIDSDLINRKRHRFPNLCLMKISSYHKKLRDTVELLMNYNELQQYDQVYIAKIFTDTKVPEEILKYPNVIYGGTGFFYDKAKGLPNEIEHSFPDYHLYDGWIAEELSKGRKRKEFQWYTDFSIGYMTRGCFRKCPFCVNKKYDKAFIASSLDEFLDNGRKYICLLDDNFLSHPQWEQMLSQLNSSGHRFQFKQGLDERLLTDKSCLLLSKSNLVGDLIFAFDNIKDRELISSKLELLRKYLPKKTMKFYVFCGFDREQKYTKGFFKQDLIDTFERIKILMNYKCLPYVMRHSDYMRSPFRGTYINLARWCNQPNMFKKKSYSEFISINKVTSACNRYSEELLQEYRSDFEEYYNMKWRN